MKEGRKEGKYSIGNLVLQPLQLVVHTGAHVLEAVEYNVLHMLRRLLLRALRRESGAKLLNGLAAEAGQSSVQHERDERDERLAVGPVCVRIQKTFSYYR